MEDDCVPRARPLVDVSNDMKLCMHNIVYLGKHYEYRMSNHVDIRRLFRIRATALLSSTAPACLVIFIYI